MKISNRISNSMALISCACLAAVADDLPKEQDLPETAGLFDISKDVRKEANKLPTSEMRVAYLSSVISSNVATASEIENFRTASAIRLLAVLRSTNSIGILVSNIAFVDIRYRYEPSIDALVAIGEPTTPYLLDVLKDPSATPERCRCAVKALMHIKGANSNVGGWIEFVLDQEKKLPKGAWDRLRHYGSNME